MTALPSPAATTRTRPPRTTPRPRSDPARPIAGSNDTDATDEHDTAIATGVAGGTATSTANGTGVLAFTLAIGPTAVATTTATSTSATAETGSVAVAFNNNGQLSVSVGGTPI